MGRYAILVPPFIGHLNPLIVLARALEKRGHQITFLSALDAEPKIRGANLRFLPVATPELPTGAWNRIVTRNAELTGFAATTYICGGLGLFAKGVLRDLPQILARENFDGIILDQVSPGGESVCEVTRIPTAVACCALIFHSESGIPPTPFSWPPSQSLPSRIRNILALYRVYACAMPVVRHLIPYRIKHRLPAMSPTLANEIPPSLVQVSQQPPFFDYPRKRLPTHFHYTGPWVEENLPENAPFPWEKLDGRPLIYASMGTLQNRLHSVFKIIAEACAGLDAQLVLALGNQTAQLNDPLPGSPIVVGYAPQRALLKRASLVITHAGLNTTLETVREGLPIVAIPVTNDQPGVAARLKHLGLGEFIPVKKVTAENLRQRIEKVRASPAYRNRALTLSKQIPPNAADTAAHLIDRAFTTKSRILNPHLTSD